MAHRLSRKMLSTKRLNEKQALTPWDRLSLKPDIKWKARQKFARLASSVKSFETLRDSGAPFPRTSESETGDMGQK